MTLNGEGGAHLGRSEGSHRQQQLRLAKRRQREREKRRGVVTCELRLPQRVADKFKTGRKHSDFVESVCAFIDRQVLSLEDYESLRLLAWNRSGRFVTRAEAFALYERNWRHVDSGALSADEKALIEELTREYGNGVFLA